MTFFRGRIKVMSTIALHSIRPFDVEYLRLGSKGPP